MASPSPIWDGGAHAVGCTSVVSAPLLSSACTRRPVSRLCSISKPPEALSVLGFQRLQDVAVLLDAAVPMRLRVNGHVAGALDLRRQRRVGGEKNGIARELDHAAMELPVQLEILEAILAVVEALHLRQMLAEPLDVLVFDAGGGQLAGVPLQPRHHVEQFADVLSRDGRHPRAAIRHEFDQPLGGENLQRFAEWGPRDSESLTELLFVNALAGGQFVVYDEVAQSFG